MNCNPIVPMVLASLMVFALDCADAQTSVTISPDLDGYVIDSSTGTGSAATTPGLMAGRSPSDPKPRYRSFLHFKLSAIPSNAVISAAVLRLNLQAYEGASTAWIELRRVLAPWSTTLSWNNQPPTAAPSATAPVGIASRTSHLWSIPALAQEWVRADSQNFGLALQIANEPSATATRTFAGRNHKEAVLRPQLSITYTVPGLSVTPTSIAFGDVPIGTTARSPLTLKNIGNLSLVVTDAAGTNPVFRLEGLPTSPFVLAPGQQVIASVAYTPLLPRRDFDRIRIRDNDSLTPDDSLDLTGTGEQSACPAGPLPLHITVNGDDRKIWNVDQNGVRSWNYEGHDYDYPASDNYPDGYAVELNRALCTEHFLVYYADQGDDAVTDAEAEAFAQTLEEGWQALVVEQGFRAPADLQADGRYTIFQNFERIPALITNPGAGLNGAASAAPAVVLNPNLAPHNRTPIHELFHVIIHGYTEYAPGWLNEGLARWSQQFRPGTGFECGHEFLPLHHDFLTRKYCESAPWFQYLGLKYSADQPPDGSDVIRSLLEEMADTHSRPATMLAFERALDLFDATRASGPGQAFAEFAAGNYVDDTVQPATLRAHSPLFPRHKEGGWIGPGGHQYVFRDYSFVLSRAGTVTIQIRASAGDLDSDGDDDDLRVLLDGIVLGDWNSENAFDGATLQGRMQTLHLVQTGLDAGTHNIRLEADEQPVLYSMTVFEGEVPLLVPSSPEVILAGAPYPSYAFDVTDDTRNVTVLLSGVAQTNESAHLVLDANPIERDNDMLAGSQLEGDLATVEVHLNQLATRSHTLEIRGSGNPLIRDIVAFPTPAQPPLLQVRTVKLLPWSASYQVVPVTPSFFDLSHQEILAGTDAVLFEFNTIEWNDDITPPCTELIRVAADGTKRFDSFRTQQFDVLRGYSADNLETLGDGGRLVHVTTATTFGGTYELIITRVPDENDAPVLAPVRDRIALEGQTLQFAVSATDEDLPANHLTYRLGLDTPPGAVIDSQTGEFTWTPTEQQGGNVYDISVTVTDDGEPRLADSETFRVTVAEVNRPPQLDPIADCILREGEALSLMVGATDPDRPLNGLAHSIDPGAPGGMTIDEDTGWLAWIPNEAQGPGTYLITVRVTDNGNPTLDATRSFTVTVNEVNRAPSLPALADRTVHAGTALGIDAAARDSDIPANTLSYTLVNGPAGVLLNAHTGRLEWTPTDEQAGTTHQVSIRVTDDGSPSLEDKATFSISVIQSLVIRLEMQDGRALLTWKTAPGQRYRVQYCAQLGHGDWKELRDEVLAESDSVTVEDAARADQRFYRVEWLR